MSIFQFNYTTKQKEFCLQKQIELPTTYYYYFVFITTDQCIFLPIHMHPCHLSLVHYRSCSLVTCINNETFMYSALRECLLNGRSVLQIISMRHKLQLVLGQCFNVFFTCVDPSSCITFGKIKTCSQIIAIFRFVLSQGPSPSREGDLLNQQHVFTTCTPKFYSFACLLMNHRTERSFLSQPTVNKCV